MKPLSKSRTMWTAALIVVTGASTAATAVVPAVGILQGHVDPHAYLLWVAGLSALSSILGAVVMWLRAQDAARFGGGGDD